MCSAVRFEPMNIKDSILTGFGAGLTVRGPEIGMAQEKQDDRLYHEDEPELSFPDSNITTYLFYPGTEDYTSAMFYEYVSSKFIEKARDLKRKGKQFKCDYEKRWLSLPMPWELTMKRQGGKELYLSTLKRMRKLHLKEIVSVFKDMDVSLFLMQTG